MVLQELIGALNEPVDLVLVHGEHEIFPGLEMPVQGRVPGAGAFGDRVQGRISRLGERLQRGHYGDTFLKADGAWLFAERNLYVDWIETKPSHP